MNQTARIYRSNVSDPVQQKEARFVAFWLESCVSKNRGCPTAFPTSYIFKFKKSYKMVYYRERGPFVIAYILGLIKDECDLK
jgi:hypothetical protein